MKDSYNNQSNEKMKEEPIKSTTKVVQKLIQVLQVVTSKVYPLIYYIGIPFIVENTDDNGLGQILDGTGLMLCRWGRFKVVQGGWDVGRVEVSF